MPLPRAAVPSDQISTYHFDCLGCVTALSVKLAMLRTKERTWGFSAVRKCAKMPLQKTALNFQGMPEDHGR